jgi:hypothetical protein
MLFSILALALLGVASSAQAQQKLSTAWAPSPIELAQIPQYCWGYLKTPYENKPEFMMQGCGGGVHHYCVAKVYLLRAQKPTLEAWIRKDSVKQAKTEIDYAMQRLTPTCPVKDDFEAVAIRQRILEKQLVR